MRRKIHLAQFFLFWTILVLLDFGIENTTAQEPNTGSDSQNRSWPFYSHLVHQGIFNGREHADMLDVYNGHFSNANGDTEINSFYDSEDSADDAEWETGAVTVANLNNTDSDKIRFDGSPYETTGYGLPSDGVVWLHGWLNGVDFPRDELDLIRLVVKIPDDFAPHMKERLMGNGRRADNSGFSQV